MNDPIKIKNITSFDRHLDKKRARIEKLKEACHNIIPNLKPVCLEIGCGHGDFLVDYAKARPNSICIGLDMISRRIRKSNRKKKRFALDNVHFLKAEVTEFFDALPAGVKLDRIFLLFPDPWPKKRHHKNRLIQTEFLNKLANLSRSETKLYFRTDHIPYFEWAEDVFLKHARWKIDPSASWPFDTETYFQKLLKNYRSLIAINQVL